MAVAVVVVGALAVVGLGRLGGGAGTPGPGPSATADPAGDRQSTVVLATFEEAGPQPALRHIVVLAADAESAGGPSAGTVLLVPPGVVADVPGRGLLPLRRAFAFGGPGLLDATLDNLLGVDFDRTVGISRGEWATLFTRFGGLTVEVPRVLRGDGGDGPVRFETGEQYLDGPRVAEYLTIPAGQSELDRLTRARRVIDRMLAVAQAEPERLEAVFADGAAMLDTPDPEAVRDVLARLAALRAEDRVVSRTLPVSPIAEGEGTYRMDEERATTLIADRFVESVPDRSGEPGRELQILNGNGIPGIGQQVAERLIPAGFEVVLTGNADSFDHPRTRILIYSDDPEQRRIAAEIRELLGVGEIQRSETPQSVVDVTIIVGRDFPPGGPSG